MQNQDYASITPREKEIWGWLARGKTRKETAVILHISDSTVKGHIECIYRKLYIDNRISLLRLAIKHGIITTDEIDHER